MVVVVLPVPPFWLITEIIFAAILIYSEKRNQKSKIMAKTTETDVIFVIFLIEFHEYANPQHFQLFYFRKIPFFLLNNNYHLLNQFDITKTNSIR
jgi:hypothetical protein